MKSIFIQICNLFKSIELISFLVKSNFKEQHTHFFLGYVWWILNPLLWMVVYLFLIEIVFQLNAPHYALFIMCTLIPWRAFSLSVTKSMLSLQSKKSLIRSVPIPKIIFPISAIISETLMMIPALIIFFIAAYWEGIMPSIYLLYLPLILLIQMMFAFFLGLFLCILMIYIPDIQNVIQFFLRVWFYISPGLYSASQVPENFRYIFNLNPFTFLFESYRNVLLYAQSPSVNYLFYYLIASSILLLAALTFFSLNEHQVVKAF